MSLADYYYKLPWATHPEDQLVAGLNNLLGDGDAIVLLPYDDGTFYPKKAYFDKSLIGGMGGYETDDGDKIVMDGTGDPVRQLFGVPIVLAIDPTEHAAAVDPIKALLGQKDNIGEWIRVDRAGNPVQVGPAIEPPPAIVDAETVEEAVNQSTPDELLGLLWADYDPDDYDRGEKEDLIAENREQIEAHVEAQFRQAGRARVDSETGMVADGGMAGELVEASRANPNRETLTFEEALKELAEQGKIRKLYDIAPPANVVRNEAGGVDVEEATHIAVDQSKAADLLPKKHSTEEINVALDKARMEEHEEGKLMTYMTYGIIIGAVGILLAVIVMFFLFQLGG